MKELCRSRQVTFRFNIRFVDSLLFFVQKRFLVPNFLFRLGKVMALHYGLKHWVRLCIVSSLYIRPVSGTTLDVSPIHSCIQGTCLMSNETVYDRLNVETFWFGGPVRWIQNVYSWSKCTYFIHRTINVYTYEHITTYIIKHVMFCHHWHVVTVRSSR